MLVSIITGVVGAIAIMAVGVVALVTKEAWELGGDTKYVKDGIVKFSRDGRSAYRKSWLDRVVDGYEVMRMF